MLRQIAIALAGGATVFNRSLIIVAVVVIALSPLRALAAPCDVSWLLENRNIPSSRVAEFKNQGMHYLTVPTSRIRMLVTARNRIGAVAGSVPDLLICGDDKPNAYARYQDGTIALTIGMLNLIGDDKDLAAAIIGHEIAHIILEHGEMSQSRSKVLNFIGLLAGIAINVLIEEHTGLQQDIVGGVLATLSTTLVANSFGRSEERDADEAGLKYASRAGYDPNGSVRLWQKMIALGNTEGGIFATHPGSQDRLESLKVLIAGLPPRKPELEIVATTQLEHEPVGSTFPRVSAALIARYDYQVQATDYDRALRAYVNKDYLKARRLFNSSAQAGDRRGAHSLGSTYLLGIGGEQDSSRALSWYIEAAKSGHTNSKNILGVLYLTGLFGVSQNLKLSKEYLKDAAEEGHAVSQGLLAYLSLNAKDFAKAKKYAAKSASQNNPIGHYVAGYLFLFGPPKYRDCTKGLDYLEKASKSVPLAWGALGVAHLSGTCLDKNPTTARELFEKGNRLDDPISALNLGRIYKNGYGVPRDFTMAFEYIYVAAMRGLPLAMTGMGDNYNFGWGVTKDPALAWAWYSLSYAQMSPKAQRIMAKVRDQLSETEFERSRQKVVEIKSSMKETQKLALQKAMRLVRTGSP